MVNATLLLHDARVGKTRGEVNKLSGPAQTVRECEYQVEWGVGEVVGEFSGF